MLVSRAKYSDCLTRQRFYFPKEKRKMKHTKIIALIIAVITVCALMIPSVSAADIDSGLVAYYTFDDADVAKDATGNANGSATNGGTLATAEGKIGNALRLDSTESIKVDNSKVGTLKNFTVAAWLKVEDVASIIIHTNNGWGADDMNLSITGSRQISAEMNGLWGRWAWWTNDNDVGSDWAHVSVVVDMTDTASATYYVNGVEVAKNTLEGDNAEYAKGDFPGVNFTNFYIAGGPNGNQFTGLMDELRVYNRALSADDVQALAAYTGETDNGDNTGDNNTTDQPGDNNTDGKPGDNEAGKTGFATVALAVAAIGSGAFVCTKKRKNH